MAPSTAADSSLHGLPENIAPISVNLVDQQVRATLDLLSRTYHTIDDQQGGWYHDLTDQPPGPVATAVALLAFRLAGQAAAHADAAWCFLRRRQLASRDPLKNGGWATNTTEGQPIVEATVIAVRLLGRGNFGFAPFAANGTSALAFLANHQNDDGGWGSLRGNPSRTTLTAQALSAVASLCPDHSAVAGGIRWLLAHQTASSGWGEMPSSTPTVVHTALALNALADCQVTANMTAMVSAYGWLEREVLRGPSNEVHAHMETYNIAATTGQRPRQWRETMHHHGLALAATALLRHPSQPPARALSRAYATILATQLPNGEWAFPQESPAPALWPTWYCLSALLDLRHAAPLRSGDTLVWFDHAVVTRRASAGATPLRALVTAPRPLRFTRFLRHHWTSVLLGTTMVITLGLAVAGVLDWPTALLGLLLPVTLLVMQETGAGLRRTRDRDDRPSNRRP